MVLHTPGGLARAALQIAQAVRDHKSKVTVFVPHYAMSGGTLIALAADEIVMCKHSVLGAIDPQLGDSPAASLLKIVEQKPVAEIDDQTLIRADIGRKAIAQVTQAAAGLLRRTLPTKAGRGWSPCRRADKRTPKRNALGGCHDSVGRRKNGRRCRVWRNVDGPCEFPRPAGSGHHGGGAHRRRRRRSRRMDPSK